MLRISLKSFLAKKFRLLSTSTAIMLGIAFLSGSMVLLDTIGRTFDDLVAGIYDGVDAEVRSTELLETDFANIRGPVDSVLLAQIQDVNGVVDAVGNIEGFAQIVGTDGNALGNPAQGAPTLGFAWTDVDELNPMVLTGEDSRAPTAAGEVVVDKASADTGNLSVGQTITILTKGPPEQFVVVGIARFGEADSPAGATLAIFDPETAQRLLGEPGKFSSIDVIAEDGLSQVELRDRLAQILPADTEAITGEALIEENQTAISDALGFFNTFMLIFAGVALFVASFIIYNTFSIIVAQRTKEMALLRALGASGRQLLGSVLLEALLVALVASTLGIVAGLGVAMALKALLAGFGVDIPTGSVVFLPATVIISMVVGIIVTLVSALVPALRAARTPPMAAIREAASDSSGQSRTRLAAGALLTSVGIAGILVGLFIEVPKPAQIVGLSAATVFLGVAALGPILATPVAQILGRVLTPIRGFPGQLAGENAARNPKRTSATASALMIGIALVGFITIFAASTKASIDRIIDDAITGDFVVESSSFGLGGLSPELAQELNEIPEVETASGIRVGFAEIGDDTTTIFAADTETVGDIVDVGVLEGRIVDLGLNELAVHEDVVARNGWQLGSEVDVRFADTGPQSFIVSLIYSDNQLTGNYFMSNESFAANFNDVFDFSVYVETVEGVAPNTVRGAIEDVASPYANATVRDMTEFKEAQSAPVDQLLGLVYALLGLSILIAVLGIANTLALSIVERTHEIGLLRAVGMSRRQVRAAVRWESVVIALLGTGMGITIGVFFGWAVVEALRDEGFSELSIPVVQLIVIAALGALVGVLAALGPARRAARLNILQSIATD